MRLGPRSVCQPGRSSPAGPLGPSPDRYRPVIGRHAAEVIRAVVFEIGSTRTPRTPATPAEELGEGASSNRSVTGEVVVLALPYEAIASAVAEHQEGIAGRVVIDIVNSVDWSTMETVATPAGASAAEETARLVQGPKS